MAKAAKPTSTITSSAGSVDAEVLDEPVELTITAPATKEIWLNVSQVAKLINKPVSTVWRWIRDGLIDSQRKPGTQLRQVELAAINKFLGATCLVVKNIKLDDVQDQSE